MPTAHRPTVARRWCSRALCCLVAAATAALALAGCASTGVTPGTNPGGQPNGQGCPVGTSLVLIVPVHQGAPAPSVPVQWRCPIESAVHAGVPISVVTAEGIPTLALAAYSPALDTTNPETMRTDSDAAQNRVIAAITNAKATSDGNDLLAALTLAADQAAVSGPGGVILSLDPGITDTGTVRTVEAGMTLAAPEDMATFTTEHKACPPLADTTVIFYAVGYTSPPQPPLSRHQVANLSATWVAVAASCGANVSAVPLPRTGAGPTTAHTTAVAAPEPAPTMAPTATCRFEIPDSHIGFLPDSATFADQGAAAEVIAHVAAAMEGCKGAIEVTGMTSSAGTPDGRARVAAARAQRVRDLLSAALHVDATTITARAVGFDTAQGSVPDRVDGLLSPALALANRKVVITVAPDAAHG